MIFVIVVLYIVCMLATFICLEIYGGLSSGFGTDRKEARKAMFRIAWGTLLPPVFWLVYVPLLLVCKGVKRA